MADNVATWEFDTPGVYEFQVWANYVELQGQTAQIRVLDARDKP